MLLSRETYEFAVQVAKLTKEADASSQCIGDVVIGMEVIATQDPAQSYGSRTRGKVRIPTAEGWTMIAPSVELDSFESGLTIWGKPCNAEKVGNEVPDLWLPE